MKKKTNQKRGYGSFFLRTLALMLASAFAVGLVACWGFYEYDYYNQENIALEQLSNLRDWLLNPENTDPTEAEIKTQLSFKHGFTDASVDRAYVLYDTQTGKTYDSSRILWCLIKIRSDDENMAAFDAYLKENGEKYPFLNTFDDSGNFCIQCISDDPAIFADIDSLGTETLFRHLSVNTTEVYTNGETVIPVNATLDIYDTNFDRMIESHPMKSPDEKPEGYVHFVSKNMENPPVDAIVADALFLVHTPTDRNNPAMQSAYEYMEWFHSDTGNKTGEHLFKPKTHAFRSVIHYAAEKVPYVSENQRFELYTVTYYNFVLAHILHFIIFGGGLFILLLILSLLIARIRYVRYCKDYEINEYRKSLTASLAHDLKTPLTAISGYAENLLENVHTEKRENYAQSILDSAQHMNNIITDVLDLAKLEQSSTIKTEPLELIALAEETAAHLLPLAAEKELSLKISGKCEVSANRNMMVQAISNLLDNAVRYTPQGGSITATGERKSGKSAPVFRITNDSAADILLKEDIAEPFVKGNAARTAHKKNSAGSGIGLAIVRQICRMHGFRLDIIQDNKHYTASITTK